MPALLPSIQEAREALQDTNSELDAFKQPRLSGMQVRRGRLPGSFGCHADVGIFEGALSLSSPLAIIVLCTCNILMTG